MQLEDRPVDNAGYEAWVRRIEEGRLFCGAGRSHILAFNVGGRRSGEELKLARPGAIRVDATAAARFVRGSRLKADYRSNILAGA